VRCGYLANRDGIVHVTNGGGGVANATANNAMELPSALAVKTQIAPVCAGLCAGHMNLQCASALTCELAGALDGCAGPASAQIIHSPFKDRGTSSANVASLRSMTVAETMNKPLAACQGLFRGQSSI
jgi:hypothetical protein